MNQSNSVDVQLLRDMLAAKYLLPATWPALPDKYHTTGFQYGFRISGLKELSLKTVPDRRSSDMGLWWEQGPIASVCLPCIGC